MTRIVVLGGTGYTGTRVVREAVARGHDVSSLSRTAPTTPVDGADYHIGSISNDGARKRVLAGADVVIAAISPRAEPGGELRSIYSRLAREVGAAGARLGVIGGFGALRLAAGAPRIAAGGREIPPQFVAVGAEMVGMVEDLIKSAPVELEWFYVSPASAYGVHAPGDPLGRYRVGGDVAIFDDDGASAISGADFATAILDEIEHPEHHNQQFSVAY